MMRALRSEAESAAARAMAMTHQLRYRAMERHYLDLIDSKSWRLVNRYRAVKNRLASMLGLRRTKVRSVRSD